MAKTSILTILIQLNKAGNGDKATTKALAEVKANVGLAVGAFAALTGAAIAVDKALDQTVGVFVNYAAQVRELARLTGATAEETSRLIQAADDVTISYESLQKALWFASKNGIEVNVESLARLADEYVALAGPTERAEFLAKKFGKGGAEMGKLLEQAGSGVRKLTDAIDDNLVLTDDALAAARQYEIQTDNLKDTWEGLKVAMGQGAVPVLNDVLTAVNNNVEAGERWKGALYAIPIYGQILAIRDLKNAHAENAAATVEEIARMKELRDAEYEAIKTEEELRAEQEQFNAQLDQLNSFIGGDLTQTWEDYTGKLAEYKEQLAQARSEEDKRAILDKINAEKDAYNERATAIMFNIQQQAILAGVESQQIDPGAAISVMGELANAYGMIDLAQKNAMLATGDLTQKFIDGSITQAEYIGMLKLQQGQLEQNAFAAAQAAGGTASVAAAANDATEPIYHVGKRAVDAGVDFLTMKEMQAELADGILSGSLPAVGGLKSQLQGLPASGTKWDYFVTITTQGRVPHLPEVGSFTPGVSTGQGQAALWLAGQNAAGGPLALGTGWTMVGEEGFELVSPTGYVFTNTESKHLMASGMIPGRQMREGGGLGPPRLQSGSSQPGLKPGNGKTFATSQQQAASASQTLALIQETQETNALLRDLKSTLPRSLMAAFQQANP